MVSPFVDPKSERIYGAGTSTGSIQFVPPQIKGALTPSFSSGGGGLTLGFSIAAAAAGSHYGGRLAFAGEVDFTARRWFYFRSSYSTFGFFSTLATLAGGGLSIIFYDSLGAWAEFNWHGGDWQNRDGTVGGWQNHTTDARSASVVVDTASTPSAFSGDVDWSQISGVEIHLKFANDETGVAINFGAFSITEGWAVVGGEESNKATFALLDGYATNANNNFTYYQAFRSLTKNYDGQIGSSYSCRGEVSVGDGAELTVFEESGFSLSFYPTQGNGAGAISDSSAGSLPHVVADNNSRFFTVNQSSSDDVVFKDGRWSGYGAAGGDWAWRCVGDSSASCVVDSCQFFRARSVEIGHSVHKGVTYSGCEAVLITLQSLIAGGRIANSGSKGLYVVGGPGDYSANTIAIEDAVAGVHVTFSAAGAGVYDLTGLSDVGQTVVFHNESDTDSITVLVNEDFGATSTTTAGGGITVEVVAPPAVASVNNIVDGSRLRIFNVTQDVETFNGVVSGTTEYSQAYATGGEYSSGDLIRVQIAYQNGGVAKLGFQATAVATASGWSVLADQQDDTVYALNAIDGGAVTKFSADYVDGEIDIASASNFSSQEFYAWYVSNLTTEQGIRNFFGGYVAEDAANYRNNVAVVSIYWDNLTAANVYQTDSARIYRSDGQRPVKNGGATTGGGGVDLNWREKVFLATTGGGPLTPTQEARLLACALESKQDEIIEDIASLPTSTGGDDAEAIYSYFVDGSRADAFKADVGSIPTNPLLANDARLDNIDAAISTRLASSAYVAPDNVGIAAIPTNTLLADDTRLDNLANADVATSSRLAAAGYTAPPSIAGLATTVQLNALQAHGDLNWQTATGFSSLTSADIQAELVAYGANKVAPDNAAINGLSAGLTYITKLIDNDSALLAADGLTPATPLNARFIVTYDDDGVTPLKTVNVLGVNGSPADMPNWSRYEKA